MKRSILETMRVSQRRVRGSKGTALFTTWRDPTSHWGTKRPMRCICTRKKLVLWEEVLEDFPEEKRGSDAAPRRAIEGLARLGIRLRAARAGAASVRLRIGCVQRLTKSSEKTV